MSLTMVRSTLSALSSTPAWMVSLIKIKNTKRDGTTYAARGITLAPDGALTRFVTDLSNMYTEGDKAAINKFSAVTEYDGSAEAIKIYKLKSDNELIADEYSRLIMALSSPETTGEPLEFSANAYALKGSLDIDGEERTVILLSLQSPICVLKNRFFYDGGTFVELNKKVLNLRQNIDVIMIDDTVYLLTLSGEKLFNMERSYKAVCASRTQDVCEADMISNIDVFKKVATSGHNPRRFVAFHRNRFEKMKNPETRKTMADTFHLSLNAEGLIDTSSESTAEKLVKLLCNKGMLDPFDNVPVEVTGASRWEV